MSGSKTLLLGAAGSGKTYSLGTLREAGLKLAVLFTDPNGDISLRDSLHDKQLGLEDVHWAYVAPRARTFAQLKDVADIVNRTTYEGITKLPAGIDKGQHKQFLALIEKCNHFICDHCGLDLGPVDHLGPEWAFVMDSLSGVNTMAVANTVGARPTLHKGEYNIAQNLILTLVDKLTMDMRSHVVLTGHLASYNDEATGLRTRTISTVGQQLGPKLPIGFDDVVWARKTSGGFRWTTASDEVDLKNRNLSNSKELPASFGPLIQHWQEREDRTHA